MNMFLNITHLHKHVMYNFYNIVIILFTTT